MKFSSFKKKTLAPCPTSFVDQKGEKIEGILQTRIVKSCIIIFLLVALENGWLQSTLF